MFSFRYNLTAMLAFSRNLCIYVVKIVKSKLITTTGSYVAMICYSAVNK